MFLPVFSNQFPDAASGGEAGTGSLWLGRFIQRALGERRVRASTLEVYAQDLAMLSRWAAGQEKDVLCLTSRDLSRYVSERLERGALASTLSRHLSSCRRFYSFLVSEGVLTANPAAGVYAPRVARHTPQLVPDDMLGKLLRPRVLRDASPGSVYRARRDHAIIWMLYGTRLGISDIRLLRWPQIHEQWRVIRVPRRNGEARSFVIDGRLMAALNALRGQLATAGFSQTDSSHCFPTACGQPMTRQALCHVVHKRAEECGADVGVTPSVLRLTGRLHQAERRSLRPALLAV